MTIYRPAFVGWHAQTGRPGDQDIVALLLRSSLEAGCAPRLDLQVNLSPVDHVADVVARIVALSDQLSTTGATYHLASRGRSASSTWPRWRGCRWSRSRRGKRR